MKSIYSVLFICLILCSCNKDQSSIQPSGEIFGFETMEEAQRNLGIYADIFKPSDGSMYIRSTTFGKNEGEQADIFGKYRSNPSEKRSDGGIFQLGDIKLVFNGESQSYLPESGYIKNKERVDQITPFFGKQNEFKLIQNDLEVAQVKQYTPEKIKINIPASTKYDGGSASVLKRSNFNVNWNADLSNKNGVVAYLWWNGDSIDLPLSEQGKGDVVRNAIKLDDTGNAVIPENFFRGIPNNAVVSIFFIRGNIALKEINDNTFKFYSVTQDKHNIIVSE